MNNSAIAAAKRRRAAPPPTAAAGQSCSIPPRQLQQQQQYKQQSQQQAQLPSQQQQYKQPVPSTHKILSLREVISYFDSRILFLENLVKNGNDSVKQSQSQSEIDTNSSIREMMNQHIIEFDHRYELLATEIEDLKSAFMKLQTFTMDINKTLMDERIRILSDIPNTDQNITFELNNNETIDSELEKEQ